MRRKFPRKNLIIEAFVILLIFYSIGASIDEPIISRFTELLTSNPLLLSILISLSWGAFTAFSEPAGSIAGRIGAKRTLLIGGIIDAVGFVFVYFSYSIPAFAISLVIGGLGSALFWSASRTFIGNLTEGKAGSAFGEYVASWGLGWSFGPLFGGYLADLMGIRAPFVFGAIILLSMIFLFKWIIPDERKKADVGETIEYEFQGIFLKEGTAFLKKPHHGLRRVFILQFMQYAILESVLVFLPLYLLQLNNSEIGAVFFIQSIVFAIGSVVWGKLADKTSKQLLVGTGFFLSGGVILFLLNVWSFATAFIAMGAAGVSFAMVEPLLDAMTNENMKKKEMGLANGISQSSYGIGAIVGPIISGAVATVFGIQSAFYVPVIFCIISGFVASTIRR